MNKNSVELAVSLGKLKLKNPVIVASGTFGYGEEYISYVDLNKLGAIITKAITLKPRQGNPPPRIAETTAGLLNAIGLANVGVEVFIKDKLPFLKRLTIPVIVNVAGSNVREYQKVIEKIEVAGGVAGYEVNLSCPNVKKGGLNLGVKATNIYRIISKLRTLTKKILIVKLTPNVTNIAELALAAQRAGADAISLINTVKGMAVDVQQGRPVLSTILGGLSGPAIKPIALGCLWQVLQVVDIPVIGGGGIMNTTDALEFLITGAQAISIRSLAACAR
mgnify:CR=1 FL=1